MLTRQLLKEHHEAKQSVSSSLPTNFKTTHVHTNYQCPNESDDVEKLQVFDRPTSNLYSIFQVITRTIDHVFSNSGEKVVILCGFGIPAHAFFSQSN